MISSQVLLDSVNPQGDRLITLLLEFPRLLLAQFNTHRVFSRSAASSRAIPVKKLIERVQNDPATPVWWGKNQKGMQAKEELEGRDLTSAKLLWERARDDAIKYAQHFHDLGLHKQIANRVLEPFMNVQVVVTATEWDNFFLLRAHEDAQPEFKELAFSMLHSISKSKPQVLKEGEWHIPFIHEDEQGLDLDTKLKICTARTARTSYFFHDGKRSTIEQDINLHDRLVSSEPRHSSPAESSAMAMGDSKFYKNFRGWKQYRQVLEDGTK